mmetsp:Transcript_32378/g.94745  ORF Transcript_32378/g.94745 Transcript_32378/m.94745 type:complete len:695 (+) Transcript_32378:3-2087(+)
MGNALCTASKPTGADELRGKAGRCPSPYFNGCTPSDCELLTEGTLGPPPHSAPGVSATTGSKGAAEANHSDDMSTSAAFGTITGPGGGGGGDEAFAKGGEDEVLGPQPLLLADQESIISKAKSDWDQEQGELLRKARMERWHSDLEESRRLMKDETKGFGTSKPANRYGTDSCLPMYEPGKHVPVLGLINTSSGAAAGLDILAICKMTPYYQDRMFNIIEVVKGTRQGGLMDVFRVELSKAKDEAKAMGVRPRLISGGGDGTASFALFILFLALQADPERAEFGMADTGNGFIWTDEEMAESFPALAQMPLGSANDCANILGWGQKYPGDRKVPCTSHNWCAQQLRRWFECAIDPATKIANFDIWGILPLDGAAHCDFKLAELTGPRGRCPNQKVEGSRQLHLKEAGKPVPLFVCLYFSAGFGAYMTARFQINRHKTPITNRMEYVRQGLGIISESAPPQMHLRLDKVEIDCDGSPYFPPRRHRGNRGTRYREVGFYNINWQAHALHGADRAGVGARMCSSREPVKFNDGRIDMFRWKFASLLKNPGLRVQTDKRRSMRLRFSGARGTGVFFQWDGEARFAFSPTGEPFNIFIRQVMNIPVVLGPLHDPSLTGNVDNGSPVRFAFCGDSAAEVEIVRQRVLRNIRGELDQELNASRREIESIPFPMNDPPPTSASTLTLRPVPEEAPQAPGPGL